MDYIKGSPPKLLDTNATVVDTFSPDFGGGLLKVTITSGADANDRLAIRNQGTNAAQIGISGTNVTYGSTNIGNFLGGSGASALVVSFTTNATVPAIQALARNLTFQSLSNNPPAWPRTLRFDLSDGDGGTNVPVYQTVRIVCPVAVDAMLVMDVSQSLSTNDFQKAKEAGSNFVSRLQASTDRVGLISFAHYAELEFGLTNNFSAVQAAILALAQRTGTLIHPPLHLARTNLSQTATNTLPLLILLSDGIINNNPAVNTNEAKNAANTNKEAGIRIIAVAYGTSDQGTNLMRELASSPSDFYYAPTAEEIQTNYNAIAQGLCRSNTAPSVLITTPTNSSFYPATPTNVVLSAMAVDADGQITNFAFYSGSTRLDAALSTNGSTFTLDWRPKFGGTNTITARAKDDDGAEGISTAVTFVVNHPPSVTISSPTNGQFFAKPNNDVTIQVSASDVEASGSVTNVEFFRDDVLLGVDTTAPYSFLWANAPTGTYVLAARATDNHGATRTSLGVTISIYPTNAPPVVNAGTNQTIRLPSSAVLVGRVSDDGLPYGTNLSIWWSKVNGPGSVTFSNSNLAGTTASFSTTGTYELSLTANDSVYTVSSNISITVLNTNAAPVVNAGPDQTFVMAAQVPFTSSTNVFLEPFTRDSKGKEFWLAFPQNHELYPSSWMLSLLVASEKDSLVNVTVNGIGFMTNVSVTASNIVMIGIPATAETIHPDLMTNLAVHVLSDQEISVYGVSRRSITSDGFLGFPVDVLGTNYVVMGYPDSEYTWGSQFAVVATREKTEVVITPSTNIGTNHSAGVRFTNFLGAGQIFMVRCPYGATGPCDVSGTRVTSDKPIAVFGGHLCTPVPTNSSPCDYMVEQLLPPVTWGMNFVTMPFASRDYGDEFRVMAAENGTTISTNGGEVINSLTSGGIVEFRLTAPTHITANKPILVAQYATSESVGGTGDPFMQLVPPTTQFMSSYIVQTVLTNDYGGHFVNVMCPTSITNQVKLDGTNVGPINFTNIANSGFAGAQLAISTGVHRLEAPLPFAAIVYGFTTEESYGYLGGLSLVTVSEAKGIVLSPNPGTNEIKTTRCILATVTNSAGAPLPGMRVDFQVVGTNQLSGFALTEGNGIARFCYSGATAGLDVITAWSGTITNKATNYWTLPFVRVAGTVSDDGLPGVLTHSWSSSSGPAGVTFGSPSATNSTAIINNPGIYVLRLTAGDTELTTIDELSLKAIRNEVPVVSAGPNQTIKGASATLEGSATDDGLPVAPLAIIWSALNPPSPVTFSSTSQPQTTVTFRSPGVYQLRLSAFDGEVTINSDVIITNLPDPIPITCGENATGSLAGTDRQAIRRPGVYADYFKITAPAGQLMTMEMTSTNVNAHLSLFTTNLVLLGSDDDSLGTNNAKLVCVAPYNGDYYLEVSSSLTNQTGAYNLSLQCGPGPYVRITTPTNGTVWEEPPGEITVTVEAYHPDPIEQLDLYANGETLWTVFNIIEVPFITNTTYTITNLGTYQFVAQMIVTNVTGQTTNVSPHVVVRAGPPQRTVTPMACNQIAQGTLATTDEKLMPLHRYADYYSFDAGVGDQFVISLASTNLDTLLAVYNASWTLLATNDDQLSGGTDSQLVFTTTNAGTHYIQATSWHPLQTGAYTLELACTPAGSQPEIAVFLGTNELVNYGLVDFGVTSNGIPVDKVLTITNKGGGNLVIDDVVIYGDFSFTNAKTFLVPPASSATFTARFNAVTNGGHYSHLVFYNNDEDGGDGVERPFILNLTAIANPTNGTPPTVTLTEPSTNIIVDLPTNIVIRATASASGGTITNVDFIVETGDPARRFLIGRDITSPYEMTWNNPTPATYLITAMATDSDGRSAVSAAKTLTVNVLVTNEPPFAVIDYEAVAANSTYNVLNVLTNDIDADGDPLTIISVWDLHDGDAQIIDGGKNILYIPAYFVRGGDYFRYTVTDGKGGYASAVVNVAIDATAAPSIRIITPTSNAILTNGVATNIVAEVGPPDFKGKVEFFFHDVPIGEDTTYPYSISWTPIEDACNCGLQARATDVYGQIATSLPVMVNIYAQTGGVPPVARIANLTNQVVTNVPGHIFTTTPVVREGLFELIGDAYDTDSSPVKYKVRVFTAARELVRDVTPGPLDTNGWHVGSTNNGSLGMLDFTLIDNGAYDLELTVEAGLRRSTDTVRFGLESDLKIGHLSFSEQDLVLPVNGFPITVTRTYNSINPRKGDFGRSWTFAINDVQLELDEQREDTVSLFDDEGDEEVHPSGQFFSRRVAGERNVTLNLPDGRRTTFYYYLAAAQCVAGDAVSLCASPKWVAAPDVFATLGLINDVKLAVLPWSGGMEWWTDDGSSKPENYEFSGYVLTNRDGTEYWIKREDKGEKFFVLAETNAHYAHVYGRGRLTQIKPRSGDTINFVGNVYGAPGFSTQFSIEHRDPSGQLTRKVLCKRNEDGFISEVTDPNGLNASGQPIGPPVLKYDYAGENLIRVHRLIQTSPTTNYQTTGYGYTNRAFPHYITSITDPRGITVARNLYDLDGRLVAMIDADGRTNQFVHDLTNRHEIAINRKGYSTTNVFDLRGNVTNVINALGATNHFRYDTNGYMLASIDPLGNTTTFSNDTRGNVLEVTLPYPAGADPAKYTTRYTYDAFENQTSVTLPTGGVITNKFDATGNLLEVRDGAGNIINTNAYDANGLLIAEGDQFGALKFGYDVSGNVIRMTNTLYQITESSYDANGNLTNLFDDGITSSFQYDAQGRDKLADYGNGITLSNGYNSQLDWNTVDGPTIGHMERRFDNQGRLSGWTTPNESKPTFAYDENGQLQFETNSVGAVSRNVYDAAGRVIAVTNLATGAGTTQGYDAAGRRVAQTNALGQVTRFEYNADGSLKSMTNAFGTNVWSYLHDTGGGCCGGSGGTTSTVTDPLGREVTNVRSPLGLPVQTIQRFGTNAVTNTTVYLSGMVSAEQEGEEYPISITDQGGRTRNFGYTSLGQLERASDLSGSTYWTNRYSSTNGTLLEIVSPTRETNSFTYDQLHNQKTIRFSDGNWLTNYFNAGNRLSSNSLPSGTVVHYQYDFAGRLTNRFSSSGEMASFQYNGNDSVTFMADNTGTTVNRYDPTGRLIGIDYPTGANVRYALDKLDRIVAITNRATSFGMAYVTRYFYDAVGNITNVTDPFGGQTTFEYDRVGRRTKRTLPNGIVTEWQYNWRDHVTNIVHKTSNGTTLASVAYERATGGEPTRITREDGTYVDLKYDAALRLTNEIHYSSGSVPLSTNSYGYDLSGTRIRLVTAGVTYTNAVDKGFRVTQVKTNGTVAETYSYDNGGRITNIVRGGTTLQLRYNSADQITAVTNGVTWVVYHHDATGRPVVSTNSAGVVRRFTHTSTPGTDLESPHLIADTNSCLVVHS